MLTSSPECWFFSMATEGHGKVANGYYFLPCFSVAKMSVIIKLKKLQEPLGSWMNRQTADLRATGRYAVAPG